MGCSSMVLWMDSPYVPLSKSDEKHSAEKNITGGAAAPALKDCSANCYQMIFEVFQCANCSFSSVTVLND